MMPCGALSLPKAPSAFAQKARVVFTELEVIVGVETLGFISRAPPPSQAQL